MTVDFRFAPEVEAFRAEVRTFLAEEMAPDRVASAGDEGDLTGLSEEFERALLRRCGDRGMLGISLPVEWGGGGRPPSFQAAFNLEVAAADAPLIDTAVTLAAQPIVAWGSPAQQEFFMPRIVRGEVIMCIAYSEPDAGSDLGNLSMVAEPVGDGFVLSGVKALVTAAHKADWCLTIARTQPDVPPRDGLTMFVVDLKSPGITVRRRPTMNRWTLGEIECDRVRLGPDAVLGRVNQGWRQLMAAVATEGAGMFHIGFARHVFDALVQFVTTERDGGTLAGDPLVRDRIAGLRLELDAAERLAKRAIWMQDNGEDNTVLASMGKVYATEFLQRLALAATDIAGMDGDIYRPLFGPHGSSTTGDGRFAWESVERVHGTIGGGTNEVKRTVIAQLGLGLPRPPRVR
jgi:alkylation response protein AidB-like acyl-CoA dehydrogenase